MSDRLNRVMADRAVRKEQIAADRKAARISELADWLTSPSHNAASLLASLHDPLARLSCASVRIVRPHDAFIDRPLHNRGLMAAAKLLGCSFKVAQALVPMVDLHPRYYERLATLPHVCPPNQVGIVYTVESPDHRGVVKIGFTVDLDRRLRELRADYRTALEVRDAKVGTFVDEFVLHRLLIGGEVHREWFALDGDGACPDFLRARCGDTPAEKLEQYSRALGIERPAHPNQFH